MAEWRESSEQSCVALSGGVGGAKLALGLSKVLDPDRLIVVANTGDDFEHLGLHISPDLDTVMYTLAGLGNPDSGWGRADESWSFMAALEELGGEAWFQLGDRDLATHVERSRRLRAGESLSRVTDDFCARLGVPCRILPMTDEPVRTVVHTAAGRLAFQHYFVRDRCEPRVTGFSFEGQESARPCDALLAALSDPRLGAVVICPSNPFVSVDPILGVPGVGAALARRRAPIVAVSPIVGGQALKGPAAKMMAELDLQVTAVEIARHYVDRGLLDAFVLDHTDAELASEIDALGVAHRITNTVMLTLDDRISLAGQVLDLAVEVGGRR
jgi:LPPG:FO 2-phospho-L-lactate transferase